MPASMQPEIVFDGHAAIGGGAGIGDRQQRLMWLDIPDRRVHRFDPETGSDDVFGVDKLVGAVGLHTGKIKASGRLSGKCRAMRELVTWEFAARQARYSDSLAGRGTRFALGDGIDMP